MTSGVLLFHNFFPVFHDFSVFARRRDGSAAGFVLSQGCQTEVAEH